VLDSGNETLIQNAIISYRRQYDRDQKRKKRVLEKRNFNISFPKNDMPVIRKQAKAYQTSIIGYIKLLVKADITKASPIQNTLVYNEILQILQYYKTTIEISQDRNEYSWLKDNNYEILKTTLHRIESEITTLIHKQR
jgi:hypothetical protein